MLPGHAAHQISGDLRGIRKRFIIDVRQMGNHIQSVTGRDIHFRMIGPELAGHGRSVFRLVKPLLLKTNTESAYGLTGLFLHQCDHSRRIYTARQKGTQRHIGNHLFRDHIIQQAFQAVGSLGPIPSLIRTEELLKAPIAYGLRPLPGFTLSSSKQT